MTHDAIRAEESGAQSAVAVAQSGSDQPTQNSRCALCQTTLCVGEVAVCWDCEWPMRRIFDNIDALIRSKP